MSGPLSFFEGWWHLILAGQAKQKDRHCISDKISPKTLQIWSNGVAVDGIAGIIDSSEPNRSRPLVHQLSAGVAHRGRDRGFSVEGPMILAHRRFHSAQTAKGPFQQEEWLFSIDGGLSGATEQAAQVWVEKGAGGLDIRAHLRWRPITFRLKRCTWCVLRLAQDLYSGPKTVSGWLFALRYRRFSNCLLSAETLRWRILRNT